MCSVQCPVCSVQCAVCSVQGSACSVQFILYSVQCAMFSVQCSVCNVQCSVWGIKCAVNNVQCAVSVFTVYYSVTVYNVPCAVCKRQWCLMPDVLLDALVLAWCTVLNLMQWSALVCINGGKSLYLIHFCSLASLFPAEDSSHRHWGEVEELYCWQHGEAHTEPQQPSWLERVTITKQSMKLQMMMTLIGLKKMF